MDNYTVRFSGQFQKDIEELEQDFLGFGPDQTNRFIAEIVQACNQLHYFPTRFEEQALWGRTYHRLVIHSHKVFYRIFEDEKVVLVDFIVHGSQVRFEEKVK